MKFINKLTSLVLSVLVVLLVVQLPVWAEQPAVVYYENNFDDGIDSNIESANDYGTFKPVTRSIQTSQYGADMGVGATNNMYNDKCYFAFEEGKELNSGVVSVSFDIAQNDMSPNVVSRLMVNNVKYPSNSSGIAIFAIRSDGTVRGPNSALEWTGDTSKVGTLVQERIHSLTAVFDLDNDKVYTYFDGETLNSQNLTADFTIYDVDFAFTSKTAYFDNFRISAMSSDSFRAQTAKGDENTDYLDIYFNEEPSAEALNAQNITVSDALGTAVTVNGIANLSGRGIRIKLGENLQKGGYSVSFSEEFFNVMGNSIAFPHREFAVEVGEGRYLKSLRLKDIYGNTLVPKEKNIPEISSIILEFFEKVDAGSVTGITLEGKDFEIVSEKNRAELKLDGCLMGDSSYTLSITGSLDRDYNILLATSEGSVSIKSTTFYQNGTTLITDLSSLNIGDTVTVVTEYVKTVPAEKSFLLSASLWNGLDMNDYDYEYVTLASNDTTKSAKLDFEIKSTEKLKIKSFHWKGNGKINPIWDVTEIN